MSQTTPTTPPPPGWYDAPGEPGSKRWWDGAAWGDQVVAGPPSGPGVPDGTYADAATTVVKVAKRARFVAIASFFVNPFFLLTVGGYVWSGIALGRSRRLPGGPGKPIARQALLLTSIALVLDIVLVIGVALWLDSRASTSGGSAPAPADPAAVSTQDELGDDTSEVDAGDDGAASHNPYDNSWLAHDLKPAINGRLAEVGSDALVSKVKCPDSKTFADGDVVTCTAHLDDGTIAKVKVTVQNDDGDYVWEIVE